LGPRSGLDPVENRKKLLSLPENRTPAGCLYPVAIRIEAVCCTRIPIGECSVMKQNVHTEAYEENIMCKSVYVQMNVEK
jgi:hypothetical protein